MWPAYQDGMALDYFSSKPIPMKRLETGVLLQLPVVSAVLTQEHGTSTLNWPVTTQMECRMHVDAAYAGIFALLPELRLPMGTAGLARANSFATNAHKGLLVNFDCSCLWVQDAEPLKAALSLTPVFLRAKGNHMDYKVCSS